ncbi:MAG: penicillin-binding protein 2 [Candidatus Omnitrophica bacterium]|jgi:penicillin-binding protein 2|nr:penicillin-binding protein 2 [Candidatus Omnitrophota bacterium]
MTYPNRTKLVISVFIASFVVLGFGVFNLAIIQGAKFSLLSQKNCIRVLPQEGARGRILDRNGNPIADNYLAFDVMVSGQNKDELERALRKIAFVLEQDEQKLRKRFRSRYISESLPVVLDTISDNKKLIALEQAKFDSPGIIIQPHPLRYYPYGNLACHVLGYLSQIDQWRLYKLSDYGYKPADIVGFGGAEEKYDYILRQGDGAISAEVDHVGKLVRVIGYKPAVNGGDVGLTLDIKIQQIVQQAMQNQKGAVIIMQPDTGEILALASFPDFDPGIFIKGSSSIEEVLNDKHSPFLNRAISASYAPGSIFKLIVAVAGLEKKKINLGTSFICPGFLTIGRRQFKCWDTHNRQDLIQAIAGSCDVFFYHTGLALGPQLITDYSLRFGLAKTTGIDLPYEVSGFVPSVAWKKSSRDQKWYDGDTANFSIGQGDLLTTPIQILRVTACFANGGFLVVPHVTKYAAGYNAGGHSGKKIKVISKQEIVNYISDGMRKAVSDPAGTASILADLPVKVSGKTGSAQVTGSFAHGWFAGFFPSDRPKFAVCVFLENGKAGYYACLIAKEIITRMFEEGLI